MNLVRVVVVACVYGVLVPALAGAQQPAPENRPDQPEQQQPAEQPKYEETVIVSASKTEEKLVNAPATVSVIGAQMLESAPTQNFADLLRAVPGVNVTQVSARDINITSRGATGTLATGQLALIDGRSLYQDFFGFVMWDFLPVNFDEIKQIEVIRGPASAVWGANALYGVVNVITKSPREIQGSSLTLGIGTFDRDLSDSGSGQSAGTLWYVNGTHAGAPNARWSYKLSAGGYSSDPLPRPTGVIPGSATGQTYPAFTNTGTTQPKFDSRVDYEFEDGFRRLTFAGGVVGTEGIMHSGIGPFDINSGSVMGYFKTTFTRGALRAQFFTNVLNGDASNLLAIGSDGRPIHFDFGTNTYDFEFGNAQTIATRHVLSYGGSFRYNVFDLSLAPTAEDRKEGGIYLQDEMFLHDMLRFVIGGRLDAFSNLDDPVFSPRVAVLLKPQADHTFRLSFNRAYRAPSVINESLEATILNQANLGQIHPALTNFVFPIRAVGNPDITEQRIDAYEIGYTGVIGGRATVSAAFYHNSLTRDINFAQIATYTSANPPPTLPPPFRPAMDLLNRIGRGLPCCFTYLNLGDYSQRGVELGLDATIHPNVTAFVNYSWQDDPDPEVDADLRELNLPPSNRVNVGVNFNLARFLGNMSVTYQDEAFWQDVLDSRYHGTTDSYVMLNAGIGVKFAGDRLTTSVKVVNLANEEVQQHVFGDILKRQIVGELKVKF